MVNYSSYILKVIASGLAIGTAWMAWARNSNIESTILTLALVLIGFICAYFISKKMSNTDMPAVKPGEENQEAKLRKFLIFRYQDLQLYRNKKYGELAKRIRKQSKSLFWVSTIVAIFIFTFGITAAINRVFHGVIAIIISPALIVYAIHSSSRIDSVADEMESAGDNESSPATTSKNI